MGEHPKISFVVGAFDMERELPRTVTSLYPPYQLGMGPGDVEVLIADNGSGEPVSPEMFSHVLTPPRILRFEGYGPSPARAINEAARQALAPVLGIVVDGARIATPGIAAHALAALSLPQPVVVTTLGLHLGFETQQISIGKGYTKEVEDSLLRSISWPQDGYDLFNIATPGESGIAGAYSLLPESNLLVLKKEIWGQVGGFDERFVTAGGGFMNHALLRKIRTIPGLLEVLLLGEGTFHQVHYGATTQPGGIRRVLEGDRTLGELYEAEQAAIAGETGLSANPVQDPLLFGRLGQNATRFFFPARRTVA